MDTTCTKDFDCWLGQTCDTSKSKCAANVVPDKTQAEFTAKEAGDYVISVYGPADNKTDAASDEINPITFEFPNARREDLRLFRIGDRYLDVDARELSLLNARVRTESSLRARERLALLNPTQEVTGPAARDVTCTAEQFKYGANAASAVCYSVGQDVGPLKFSFAPGAVTVTAKVKKIVGKTAILLDNDNASVSQTEIDKLAEAFDTIAGPRDRQFFNAGAAHTGTIDTDGNGMVAIILTGKAGAQGIAGLFDQRDIGAAGNGNNIDVLWAQPPTVAYTPAGGSSPITANFDLVIGTLAHEYQHMINFARAKTSGKTETLFLNEALSHLAEDITGYGASNLAVISSYLSNSDQSGLFINGTAADADTGPLRGIGYLYLRYMFEKASGYHVADDGKITDLGGIAFIEKLMTGNKNGLESLSNAGGSFFKRFATFFPALVASGNSDAPLVATDCRFNYDAPKPDPLTGQKTGIALKDSTRKDATGAGSLLNGYQQICDKDQAEGGMCKMYMTGGQSFLWQGAAANAKIVLKSDSGFNLRLTAVKVK